MSLPLSPIEQALNKAGEILSRDSGPSQPVVQMQEMPPRPTIPAPASSPDRSAPAFDPYAQLDRLQRDAEAGSRSEQRALAEAQKEYGRSVESKKTGAMNEADIAGQKSDEESRMMLESLHRQKLQDLYDENERQAERMALDVGASELRSLEKEAAEYKIDPDRRMRSTEARLTAAIAVGLGQMSAALTGGPNLAAQIVRQSIDDDIEAQRAELAGKKSLAMAKRNELTEMRQRFGDDEQARLALRSKKLAYAEQEAQALLKRFDSPQIKARAEQAISELAAEKAKTDEDFITRRANIAAQDRTLRAQLLNSKLAVQAAKGDSTELSVPGYAGTAPSKEVAKEAMQISGANEAFQAMADELEKKVSEFGTEIFPTDAAKGLKARLMAIKSSLRKSGGFGALDKGTQEFMDEMLGSDPTQIRTGAFLSQLSAVRDSQNLAALAELKARGFTPIVKEYAPVKGQ